MREVGREESSWIVTCAVPAEQLTEFKTIIEQLVAAAKNEPGTLAYEFSIHADQTTVHIFESYRDPLRRRLQPMTHGDSLGVGQAGLFNCILDFRFGRRLGV
jgi:antibiotic biosynthesis monooxygenase